MKTFRIFDTHDGDSELNNRSGQHVEVLRALTSDEADIGEVGQMFKVRFSDGFETDVFEDEVTDPIDCIKAAMLPGFYTDCSPQSDKPGQKYLVRVSELRYGEVTVWAGSEEEAKTTASGAEIVFYDSEITDMTAEPVGTGGSE